MEATATAVNSASPGDAPAGEAVHAPPEVARFPTPHGTAYVARRHHLESRSAWREAWHHAFADRRKDWRYYEIAEETLPQGFDHYYFVLEDEEGRVRAIQPFFLLDQDLLAGAGRVARGMVGPIRWLFRRFLVSRMLMVGCCAGEGALDGVSDPDGDGKGSADGGSAYDRGAWVAASLHSAAGQFARRARAKMVVLKEFPAACRGPLEYFTRRGYARFPSLPYTRLWIGYRDFEEYLTHALSKVTRKGLRRKFRAAEEATAADPIALTVVEDVTPFVDEVYPLYLQVFGRSTLQFEKLTKEYLCALGRRMGDTARFFLWRRGGKAIAFSVCLVRGEALSDEYLGLDYAVALDLHLYFYTLRDILRWAMARGVKWYYSTALNYDPKLHLRSELVPMDLYVRHTSPLKNLFLRRLLPWLGPTRGEKVLRQFANYADLWGQP